MPPSHPPSKAFVSLITSPDYVIGLLILHECLKASGTRYPLVAMVTPSLGEQYKRVLSSRGIIIRDVQFLKPREGSHALHQHDARFEDTWTKLRAFELTEYKRIILIDSDVIVRKNMDELMDLELPINNIAACHACTCNPFKLAHYPKDWNPANCAHTPMVHPHCLTEPTHFTHDSPRTHGLLNSGLVVLNPHPDTFASISHYLNTSPLVPTFSFPDQDLLANFFNGRWKPLPYIYNGLKTLRHVHPGMWRDDEVKVVHYIIAKPWDHKSPDHENNAVTYSWWWQFFDKFKAEMEVEHREDFKLVTQKMAQV